MTRLINHHAHNGAGKLLDIISNCLLESEQGDAWKAFYSSLSEIIQGYEADAIHERRRLLALPSAKEERKDK
ncbi:hypothetical protein [Zavarzinella formosa]|uniref:hypothetical protein n=1 Tax=Zavarzinella formosa TaxID=360055 RepID=UPI0002F46424|nr:hypothetical protein [Zavarzinella formosa]